MKRFLLYIFLLLTSFCRLQAQTPKDKPYFNVETPYDTLWRQFKHYSNQRHYELKNGISCLDTIRKKARLGHNDYQLFKADASYLEFIAFVNPSLSDILPYLDSMKRTVNQPYRGLYNFLIGSYLENETTRNRGSNIGQTDLKHVEEWTAQELDVNAQHYLDTAIDELYEYADWPAEDFLFMTSEYSGQFYRLSTLFDLIAQTYLCYYPNTPSTSQQARLADIIDKAIQLHQKRNEPAIVLEYELQKISRLERNIEPSADSALYWKELDRLENQYGQMPAIDYERGVYLYELLQNNTALSVAAQNDYYRQSIQHFNNVVQNAQEPFYLNNAQCFLGRIIAPKLTLRPMQDYIIPSAKILLPISYQNIDTIYVSAYRLKTSPNISRRFFKPNPSDFSTRADDCTDLALQNQFVLSHPVQHKNYTTDLFLDSLAAGYYLLIYHTEKAWDSTNVLMIGNITVTNIAAHQNSGRRYNYFTLLDARSGSPLIYKRVVKVYDYYNDVPVKLPVYTNRKGQIRTRMLSEKSIADLSLMVKDGKDFQLEIFTNDVYTDSYSNRFYRQQRRKHPDLYPKPNYKHYFHDTKSTIIIDRSVYRPGQSVHFKAYAVKNHKLLKNHPVEVVLCDKNFKDVEVLLSKTNEYGTVSGQFTLPAGMFDSGYIVLRPTDGEEDSEMAEVYFDIAEYKLPTFKVTLSKCNEPIVKGDTLHIRGRAISYTGVPIANAKVRITVSQSYYNRNNSTEDVLVAYTHSDGRFEVPYKTDVNQFYYYISADVTDVNGETHSAKINEYLSDKPLYLNFYYDWNTDSLSGIVRCSRHFSNSQPNLTIPVTVEVFRLQDARQIKPCLYADGQRPTQPLYDEQTYQRYFPEYSMDKTSSELKYRPNGEKMFSVTRAFTPDSTLRFSIKEWASGAYRIRLTAERPDGTMDTCSKQFTILPQSEKDTFDVSPVWSQWLQPRCYSGDKIKFAVGSCLKNATIYGFLSQGKTIIKTFKTDSKDSYQTFSIRTKHNSGTLGLYLFAEQNAHIYEMDEQDVAYFRLASRVHTIKNGLLQLSLIHWNSLLEPGKKEYGEILVTNAYTGEPESAETLVWMIDSSILDIGRSHKIDWLLPNEGYYRGKKLGHSFWRNHPLVHQSITNDPAYTINFPIQFPDLVSKKWAHINYYLYSLSPAVFDADNTTSQTMIVSGENIKATPGRSVTAAYSNTSDQTIVDGVRVRDNNEYEELASKVHQEQSTSSAAAIRVRKNFQETAFFYPELQTTADGRVRFEFALPDQLTTWKLYAAAHTSNLHSGWLTTSLQTRQTLMVQSQAPRFLREVDTMTFQAKVTNLSDTTMLGKATLRLFDLTTDEPLTQLILGDSVQAFVCEKGQVTNVSWRITTPKNMEAIGYRVLALSGNYGDGEEGPIPVLPKRILVTETKAFAVPAGDSAHIQFNRLLSDTSRTREHYRFTMKASTQPMWSIILSLPYLIQYPHDCSEQTFAKYYANTLALKILDDNPALDSIYSQWRRDGLNANTESPLMKNAMLKDIALDETPWLIDAQNEQTQKTNLAHLFTTGKLKEEARQQLNTLNDYQLKDGGWGWYPGSSYSSYITNHIVAGFQKLQHFGITLPNNFHLEKTLAKMDSTQVMQYRNVTKDSPISETDIQYLYARTFNNVDSSWLLQPYVQYYLTKSTENIFRANLTRQAEVALILHRIGRDEEARNIIESLRQRAQRDATNGMYWPNNARGYYHWYEAPIERHALLMEAFHEIDPRDDELSAMTQWLLLQKQGNHWSNTKATTEAIYALLLTNSSKNLMRPSDADITVGGEHFYAAMSTTTGTGQMQHEWEGKDITPKLADVTVRADSEQPTFGALYWQYFEDMDKVSCSAEGLHLERALYHRNDGRDRIVPVTVENPARIGERVTVRFVITCDRDIEYVHLKDQRAAAFEPDNILSHYDYHNGLWYYVSPRNAATHFFFPKLSKGTHVMEHQLIITQDGEFSNGSATIECMYAPEYRATSEELKVRSEQ